MLLYNDGEFIYKLKSTVQGIYCIMMSNKLFYGLLMSLLSNVSLPHHCVVCCTPLVCTVIYKRTESFTCYS